MHRIVMEMALGEIGTDHRPASPRVNLSRVGIVNNVQGSIYEH